MKNIILFIISTLILTYKCTDDPKVNFKLSNLDSALHDIMWCGEGNEQAVIVLTEQGSIYRSIDKGMNWRKQTDQFQRTGYVEIEKGEKVGVVQRILQSPVDKKLLIFIGTHGINWVTKDCGANIEAMNQGRKVQDFQFHPTERNWLLAVAWTKCDDFENEPCQIFKELFVSFDLGENWKLIEDYVVQFSWATLDETFLGKIPKERIILAHEPQGKGHQKVSGWSEKVHVSYSDDFFKTTHTLMKYGNKFLITPRYLFVAAVLNEETQDVSLKVADPRQQHYNFTEVQLPMKRLQDHSYTILDSSEGQVFLHVNHYGPKSKYGNIYISDSTGVRYSLSLVHNVRSLDGQCDFEKMQSLEGVYLANIYHEQQIEQQRGAEYNPIPNERQSKKEKQKSQNKYDDLDSFKKTRITFDKGGMWKSLVPPIKDSQGKKIHCSFEQCALHLNSVTNIRYGPFYSTEKAVGLIIGTGNVGYYLATRQDEINTYLSRDAGLNWMEVSKGSHIYEIGDHGGLILLAPDQQATDTILYTWDEGLTFQTLKFTNTPIEITNIIIEPTSTSVQFVIYGEDANNKGVVIGVDFSGLHQRVCQGADNPNSDNSDYELWSPNGEISPKCLMGHRVNYVRRKQDTQCFNGEEFERKNLIENCECTEENWECDLGLVRTKEGTSCQPINEKVQIDYTPPQQCDGYYYVSQGYRKVAGDTCIGGVDHSPLKIPCPGAHGLTKTGQSLLIIIGLIVAIILLSNSNSKIILQIKEQISSLMNYFTSREKGLPFQYEPYKEGKEPDFSEMVFESNDNDDQAQIIEDKALQHKKEKNQTNRKLLDDDDDEQNELNDFNPRK